MPAERGRAAGLAELADLAGRARPVTLAEARLLPVLPALVELLPEGGLRRGSTVAVAPGAGCGQAGTSLAGALLAGVSAAGSWCAVAGMRGLGLAGLAEMGADLSRLAIVDTPGNDLAAVVSALLDAVDIVLVSTRERVRAGDARRLAARARERGSVLVVLETASWPAPLDLSLVPIEAEWRGLGQGHGRLSGRVVHIEVSGRGAAARPRRRWVWLPAPDGSVRPVQPGQVETDSSEDEDGGEITLAGAG
jgi:hypothetical protein